MITTCPRRGQGDAGMSMIEMVVGMMLMTIFGSMFTAAIIMMNGSANKMESVTVTTSSLNNAFVSLDRLVRYAATITTPGTSATSGDWYVELQTTNTGAEVCTQLRVDVTLGQLQRRTWRVVSSAATQLTGWSSMANSVINGNAAAGSADRPFVLTAPSGTVTFQKLGVVLMARSGNTSMTTSRSSITFAAVNSTKSGTSPASPCQQAGRP